ncbi:MAG: hypothetical protein ACK5QP_09710, partial [Chitinophagales bacterium]
RQAWHSNHKQTNTSQPYSKFKIKNSKLVLCVPCVFAVNNFVYPCLTTRQAWQSNHEPTLFKIQN